MSTFFTIAGVRRKGLTADLGQEELVDDRVWELHILDLLPPRIGRDILIKADQPLEERLQIRHHSPRELIALASKGDVAVLVERERRVFVAPSLLFEVVEFVLVELG